MKRVDQIRTICNLGCGTMGFSTAVVFAGAGYEVRMFGRRTVSIERAMTNIKAALAGLTDNGLLSQAEAENLRGRIRGVTTIEEAATGADFVIESVAEDSSVKQSVYAETEKYIDDDVIIATDSSGLSPTELSACMNLPRRFIVAHFWNPPHLLPLVEIVPGEKTGAEVVSLTKELMEKIGKKPVTLLKEAPGFIGNRLQLTLLREALHCVREGIATAEDVDAVCKYSLGRRLGVTGPIESADLGGLDIFYNISAYLYKELDDTKSGSEIMRKCVNEGRLGAKTGEGIFSWTEEKKRMLMKKREDVLIEWLKKDGTTAGNPCTTGI